MEVSVHYLFSKNSLIGSKIISWGTSHLHNTPETPSHIAVLINHRWVFESTMNSGIRILTYKKWLKINKEVAKIPGDKREYVDIKKIFRAVKNKKYDKLGVAYLSYHIALNKFFKKEIPERNKWEDPNKYFCCEAVAKLTDNYYSMKAPVDIMVNLSKP